MAEALDCVAERGLPLALYQLPQMTGNEMSAETVQAMAARQAGFYLFKDTSGKDRVAQSRLDFDGVFLVRGAEGDYARWPKSAGGPYDGFLLSTANAFARELDSILSLLDQGRRSDAEALAARVSRAVAGCFELVRAFPTGNAFTNANKVLDHLMAHGENGVCRQPPLLYSGVRLPPAWIERAAALLRQNDLMPATGYLE
jgi:dihydrodipicolinate synthase/N-acetylneuraminate lyase